MSLHASTASEKELEDSVLGRITSHATKGTRITPHQTQSHKNSLDSEHITPTERLYIPSTPPQSAKKSKSRDNKSSTRSRHAQKQSNEITFQSHVTRDSMVVDLLSSFNQLPGIQPPTPNDGSIEASVLEPPIVPDSPTRHRTSSARHFRDFSGTSPATTTNDSSYDLKPAKPFNPYQSRALPGTLSAIPVQYVSSYQDEPSSSQMDAPPEPTAEEVSRPASRPTTAVTSRSEHKKKKKSKGSSKSVEKNDFPSHERTESKSSHHRERSSSSFDLNPKDKSRRRSKTNPAPAASILNRARPVRPEYHDFNQRETEALWNSFTKENIPRRPDIPPRQSPSISTPDMGYKQKVNSHTRTLSNAGLDTTLTERSGNFATTPETPSRLPPSQLSATDQRPTPPQQQQQPNIRPQPSTDSAFTRQGFFKRVFGSARNHSSSTPDLSAYQLPPLKSTLDASGTKPGLSNNSQSTDQRQNVPFPAPPSVPADQPHVIHKKSSFFRRKKRTTSTNEEPKTEIDQASDTQAASSRQRADSASVSSLRQVMTQFLDKPPVTSPVESTYYDSKEYQSVDGRDNSISAMSFSRPASRPSNNVDDRVNLPSRGSQIKHRKTSKPTNTLVENKVGILTDDGSLSPSLQRANGDLFNARTTGLQPELSDRGETAPSKSGGHKPTSSANDKSLDRIDTGIASAKSPGHKGKTLSSSTVRLVADEVDNDRLNPSNVPKVTVDTDLSNEHRVWLHRSRSEQAINQAKAPYKIISEPTPGDYSPTAIQPIPTIENRTTSRSTSVTAESTTESVGATQEELAQARALFENNNDVGNQSKTCLVLGQSGVYSSRLRQAYMALYDFSGLNIVLAMRDLCNRLTLKGESQQVDRVLASFADRWCDCNPNHGFKSTDVVHTICYSILLLNTDLHLADLNQKMTRSQFVRNTLETIRSSRINIVDAMDGRSTLRAEHSQSKVGPWRRDTRSPSPASLRRPSADVRQADSRQSLRSNNLSTSELSSPINIGISSDASDLLVHTPFEGPARYWESQLEIVLKEFYASIRNQRLPLHGASDMQLQDHSSSNLSVGLDSSRRSSAYPKSPADSGRRVSDLRTAGNSWNIRNRSRTRLYQSPTQGSSRTSLEDGGIASPNASSTWSRSFGKAPTSMSSESLASRFTQTDFGIHQSVGFANALSHAIIREEDGPTIADDDGDTVALLEDESLELEGAPWAKEGIVHHKRHMESGDKKAKDRNWNQCFAVVEKGCMRLFSFNSKASIRSQKNKNVKGAVVGGGNWMDSAEELDSFTLRQTLANTLPPPGYSRSRPHVFALVLPTGAVHLFHVGTAEIAEEFVTTANYWSARLSKEPLVGSVSNIEYGWSDNIVNMSLIQSNQDSAPPSSAAAAKRFHSPAPSNSAISPRPSIQGSVRRGSTSIDLPGRARLPADKANLNEWHPPHQSLGKSDFKEKDQLASLKRYVKDVEDELRQHNELRPGLILAYTPRHPNAAKAMTNWERKSSYLLKEIVKFRTYIDTLVAADTARERVYKERADRLAPLTDDV